MELLLLTWEVPHQSPSEFRDFELMDSWKLRGHDWCGSSRATHDDFFKDCFAKLSYLASFMSLAGYHHRSRATYKSSDLNVVLVVGME